MAGEKAEPQPDSSKSSIKKEVPSEDGSTWKDPRESVLKLLQQVGTSGAFATSGDCLTGMTMPGLVVEGIGNVGLPLSETAALALLEKCHAIASHGAKEMDPPGFSIQNPTWEHSIQKLAVEASHQKLGVPKEAKVEAVIHKLVVLEKGSTHHIPPFDEKDNIFGTLMVTLPSSFEGGKMVVRHAGHHKTVFSQSKESPYKSQYAAFYNDCQLECEALTKGHCLCLIYNLVQRKRGPLLSAAGNNRFVILQQLRDVAAAWEDNFDGNKLVIMVDHLRDGNSSFEGDDKAIVKLLQLAVKEGVGLAWDRGTINYRIYGYGCGAPWMGYEWNATDESKMTLTLRNYHNDDQDDSDNEDSEPAEREEDDCDSDDGEDDYDYIDDHDGEFDSYEDHEDGDVTLDAAAEMIPSHFFDNQKPDETFEATYHGVKAKRNYDNQGAIVLWPKSWSWQVLAKGDIGKMCQFLLRKPDAQAAKVVSDLILAKEFSNYDSGRKSAVSSFMQVLMAVGDSDAAVSFWKQYLAKQHKENRVPDEILPDLGPFMEYFGSDDDVQLSLQDSIREESVVRDPSTVICYVSTCVKTLMNDQAGLCQLMIEQLVGSMDHLQATISAPSVEAFFAIFESCSGIADGAKLVSAFLDGVTRSSCQLPSYANYRPSSKLVKRGPVMLVSAGLPKVCAALEWQGLEESLANVIGKLTKYGSFKDALMLIKELSGPNTEQLDQAGNKYKVCTTLANQAIEPSLRSAVKEPSVQAFLDLFSLAHEFYPSAIDLIVREVVKLDLDDTIAPIALALHKQGMSPKLPAAVSKLSVHCVQVLTTRLSAPLGDVINWSLPLTADTQISKKGIDDFLCSPCKGILTFELAKHSHGQLLSDLRPLVAAGNIKAYPSRPSGVGRWMIKIDKLTNQCQPVTNVLSLSCSCWPSDESAGKCIIAKNKAKMSKRQNDESTLDQLLSQLPAVSTGDIQRKRKQADDDSFTSSDSKKGRVTIGSGESNPTQHEVIVIDD